MQTLIGYYQNNNQGPQHRGNIGGLVVHTIIGGLIGRFLGSLVDRRRRH